MDYNCLHPSVTQRMDLGGSNIITSKLIIRYQFADTVLINLSLIN